MENARKLNDTYTIVEEIGSGGGGVVYKAYHERLQLYVVMKKIKEQVRGILNERAEADILKKMKHTYLPRVYDFLEIDGDIYTVMDFIPGQSLDKALKENGRFSQKQVLKWLTQLAEALAYLHNQKPPVIHSDIKPANIMLTPEGNICLIDFNISLAFDSSMKNATGISGGYSPPEQYRDVGVYRSFTNPVVGSADGNKTSADACRPEKRTVLAAASSTENSPAGQADAAETENVVERTIGRGVDERSDIYSLGATVYHLLTGIRPSHDFGEILPISQCDAEISEGLAHIVTKMMELLPEKRYQDGNELLYALRHIYDLDSEYRAYHRKTRSRRIMIAVLYVIGAVALGSGWAIHQKEIDTDYNRKVMEAEEYIDAGAYDEASAVIEEAIRLRPERIEAYSREMLRLYQMGAYDDCIRYAADIIENPVYSVSGEKDKSFLGDMFYILGNCYIEKEDYSNAAVNLQNAIFLYSQNSLYYQDYAVCLARMGNVGEAEDLLTQAVELGLGEGSIYMVQGEIAFAKGDYAEAETYLLSAIQFAENESLRKRAVLLLDKVYREMGNAYLDTEIAFLEQEENRAGGADSAMDITERLADAYARKAEAEESVRQEYYGKAIECFELLYAGGYSTRQMMENLAILYEQTGEYDRAEDMLQDMLGKYQDSYEAYKRLAYLEADRQQNKENADRDYSRMKEYYDKAKELYGNRSDDAEMQMLDNLMEDLQDGGWL